VPRCRVLGAGYLRWAGWRHPPSTRHLAPSTFFLGGTSAPRCWVLACRGAGYWVPGTCGGPAGGTPKHPAPGTQHLFSRRH